jgi:transposase
MQGKEASEQETLKSTAGIDVSKSWLDAHVYPASRSLRVANTSAGIRQLKRWLLHHKVKLVAVEATGKWHREVCRSLAASPIAVAIVDPYRVRMFAKASGILAKTDKLDAKVLALFAATMSPSCRPQASKTLEGLQELVTARDSAVAERTALKNQLSAATSAFLKAHLKKRIAQLANAIKAIEKECLAQIKADEGLARRFSILVSIPSFGPVVAMTLIARFRELGSISRKQAGALGGLAPVPDESGERIGQRVVYGGRTAVRTILYLAAVSSARSSKGMKAFFARLVAKGTSKKAALIAVARKLIVLANTLLAEDRLWLPIPPQHA